jgi:hypothetical protein
VNGGIAAPFFTSALDGGEWSASHPSRFTSGEIAAGAHWLGGWEGPRAGVYGVERRQILHCRESLTEGEMMELKILNLNAINFFKVPASLCCDRLWWRIVSLLVCARTYSSIQQRCSSMHSKPPHYRLWWVVTFTPPLIYSRRKKRQWPFNGMLCACLDAEAHRTIPGTSPRSQC